MKPPWLVDILVVSGLVAVGLGVAVTVAPGTVGPLGVTKIVVTGLGLVALVQAGHTARDAWNVTRHRSTLPDAGSVDPVPVPGEAVDRAFASSRLRGHQGRPARARLARTLRATAIEVLVAATGDGREAVAEQLDTGTWTDDPVAAALFVVDADPRWRDIGRSLLGRETTYQRRVRRAIEVLERRLEGVDGA